MSNFSRFSGPTAAAHQFDAPTAAAPVLPVKMITVEELIDQDNTLPHKMKPKVAEARRFVLDRIDKVDNLPDRDQDEPLISERLVTARRLPDSDITKVELMNLLNGFVVDWNDQHRGVLTADQLRWVRARVIDDLLGSGAIEPLRRDTRVTEILVRSPYPTVVNTPEGRRFGQGTVVEIQGLGLVDAPGVVFDDNDQVIELMRFLHPDGIRVSSSRPLLSAALADGSRIEVAHPEATDGNAFVALRRHPEYAHTLTDLINWGTMSEELAEDLASIVHNRLNVIISGSTSSGKSTTLNALIGYFPPDIHLGIIEDTKEIKDPKHLRLVSRRLTRPSNSEGVEDVSIRTHVRAALRSRPDIIIIGEVRGPEAVDALDAMNTGHEGSMTTCHANSAHETVIRLETMMSQSGEVSEGAATHKIASSVDVIIFQARTLTGERRVVSVYEVVKPELDSTERVSKVELKPLWRLNPETGTHERLGRISPELLILRNITQFTPIGMDTITQVSDLKPVSSSR